MIMEKGDAKKAASGKDKKEKKDEDDGEDFAEVYAALVKFVQKETTKQAFWTKGS